MGDQTNLSPEQLRAHDVITSAITKWKDLFYTQASEQSVLESNFLAFSNRPFLLPPQQNWTWNQSCGKSIFSLDVDTFVVMYKMNSRKKRNIDKIPSYKVWVFEIARKGFRPHMFAVWCEKGNPGTIEGSLLAPVTTGDLVLQDFAFLSPFVNAEIAEEFGWNT